MIDEIKIKNKKNKKFCNIFLKILYDNDDENDDIIFNVIDSCCIISNNSRCYVMLCYVR